MELPHRLGKIFFKIHECNTERKLLTTLKNYQSYAEISLLRFSKSYLSDILEAINANQVFNLLTDNSVLLLCVIEKLG